VRAPGPFGNPAILSPAQGVDLYVNGVLVSGQVSVSSIDRIEIKLLIRECNEGVSIVAGNKHGKILSKVLKRVISEVTLLIYKLLIT